MIHTSLSRTAHAIAINWSESNNRRSLLPGRLPILKRRLLLSVATVAIAVVAGFVAGRSLPSASVAMPVSAPSAVAADPELPAAITLSEPKLANLQLQIEKAKAGPLVRAVSATGSVGYDQLHLARIKPTARGRIETVDVTAGDRVVPGQRLAVLDNFDLSAAHSKVLGAEAALNQAKAQLAAASAAYDRATNLIRSDLVTQAELVARRATAVTMEADLRTKEAVLRQYQEEEARLLPVRSAAGGADASNDRPGDSRGALFAPFAGVVDSVSVATGEIVDPATPIFTVSDLSTVWVQADVAERDLGAVKVGDAVEVKVSAFPDRVFAGRVTYIPDQIESGTGMAKVRCEVPNPDGALRVNMFATVNILSPQGSDAVLAPSSSLQEVNGQSVVFIPTGDRQFAWRAVHTGLVANGKTQITSGLAAGTPVVGEGSYWLKAALMQSTIPDQG
ncbi:MULTISPECIES: efflux RND transporter periplasmic adaptor subunit [Bradyrhizobium]|uniref:Membrane fusion protein, cobalt-zinc-cadmium efflux system n=2 Tax=Bradyrhizobium TaxID=374 RepID=A0ABY0QD32_9BRAD|nr:MULTISPECIES: efflux RND transporter periplasmic adaptor subunit [Bradyrhizobium]SDJ92634.1 membrane fusion protein, cobalt-zinc-cadmium efflux system [Bradyrhizobium ottawaense]SEB98290.1 membrane fusion protein, cobalt-zinc-cadmium efflux system [Bradyrhizobium lablabi]SHM66552.1 membrane fusion protein, cobalt-zinc-cadmium efflux system [Bradyrhizobium lablabi]